MARRKKEDRRNVFEQEADIQEVADQIYGQSGSSSLASNRVVAKPIALHLIYPDFRQPRRGIPMVVRGKWDGRPEEIGEVLDAFHAFAEAEAGREIDVASILAGRKELVVDDKEKGTDTPLFDDYANLIILAQNIENEGLTNPITVVKKGSLYQVETGERRWLAFHLLAKFLDADKYGKIPAREVEYDAFRQASENNARRSLDAIALSRQVCILIMELLDDEHDYYSMEKMILPGENERRYYAQVANGYVHQVPPALRPKIQKAVRGLGWSALTNYKNLSALTGNDVVDDALWLMADKNKWTETALRELKVPKTWDADFAKGYVKDMEAIVKRDNWTLDDLKELKKGADARFTIVNLEKKQAETPPQAVAGAPSGEGLNKQVATGGNNAGDVSTKNAQDYFGRAVMVQEDGYSVPGIVQGVDAVSGSLRVMFKDGSLGVVAIERVRLDRDVAPNKVGSQTLAGYMETPTQTPSQAVAGAPSGEGLNNQVPTKDADAQSDSPFGVGATVEAVTHGGVSYIGTIVSVSGGLYTVSTSEGEMPFQAFQLTPYEIVNSTLDLNRAKNTLYQLTNLARQLKMFEALEVIDILMSVGDTDIETLAKMSATEVEVILSGYEAMLATLLERAMQEVEGYTGAIREQVAKARESSK